MQTIDPTPLILWNPPDDRAEQDCACADPDLAPALLWTPPDDRAEDDCACPDHGLAPSLTASFNPATRWRRPSHLHRAPLPGEHELTFNPTGRAGVVVLNQPARQILDAFTAPRTPAQAVAILPDLAPERVRRAAHQLAALDLLAPIPNIQHLHSRRSAAQVQVYPISNPASLRSGDYSTQYPIPNPPHTLTAWLHVTDACNLRCAYCYVDKSGEAMDETTGRTAVEAVFRSAARHQFRAVKLKYAGGEPLLNFGLVQALHEHARRLADQGGLSLREVLLSNGAALSDTALDWFGESGVRLMISLDGVGAAHDAQRSFANGQGSFEHVARGIDRALARGVRPYLSLTVTDQNADHLVDAVAFALDRGLLFNLNFYRQNDLAPPRAALQAKDRRLIAGVRRAFAVIEARQPRQSLIGALVDRASFGAPHNHACGAGRNYLVIDQRGRISRCQMEMERPVTDVWAGDPLVVVRADRTGFQNLPAEDKEGCRGCSWRTWCAGGCPLLTHRVTGRDDVKSPYCDVYRALLPQALRLEGLRLLKWRSPAA